MSDRVAVIIVNWNGWEDTIECLRSVYASTFDNYQVIVVDNGSADSSVERIMSWASDTFGGGAVVVIEEGADGKDLSLDAAPLVVIRQRKNLGFAGGINAGLRHALRNGRFSHFWLLNNDTIVESAALSELLNHMRSHPDIGMCGSKLRYFHAPSQVQACGGAMYNRWVGTVRNILVDSAETVRMSYVVGASMMLSREFLNVIGLMNEEYFLYFEELDWAERAKGRFSLGYAPGSVVYHKEGAAAGTSADPSRRSTVSDYYLIRNRVIFTRKFHPYALPTIYLGILIVIMRRIMRGQYSRIPVMLRGAFSRRDVFGNV